MYVDKSGAKKKLHTLVLGGGGNREEKAALLLRYLEYQLW